MTPSKFTFHFAVAMKEYSPTELCVAEVYGDSNLCQKYVFGMFWKMVKFDIMPVVQKWWPPYSRRSVYAYIQARTCLLNEILLKQKIRNYLGVSVYIKVVGCWILLDGD